MIIVQFELAPHFDRLHRVRRAAALDEVVAEEGGVAAVSLENDGLAVALTFKNQELNPDDDFVHRSGSCRDPLF